MDNPDRYIATALDLAGACHKLVKAMHQRHPTKLTEEVLSRACVAPTGEVVLWLANEDLSALCREHGGEG